MFTRIVRLGCLVLACGAAPSACGAHAEGDGATPGTSQEALQIDSQGLDGDACCAVDYRGGGKTIMCGVRKGEWCCTEDDSDCALCSWYECEPPPPVPLQFKTVAVRSVSATIQRAP